MIFVAVMVGIIFLIAGVVYAFVASSNEKIWDSLPRSLESVKQSSKSTKKEFEILVRETGLTDMFSDFPADEEKELTAQSIVEKWEKLKIDKSKPHFRHAIYS